MGSGCDRNNLKIIWFDENIKEDENQEYLNKLKIAYHNIEGYKSLNDGFVNFYKSNDKNANDFRTIITIVSGRLFGRYIKKLKENINKIVNIPYTYIFTSIHYREVLLNKSLDDEHILSYDTMISINNGFYNPGGVFDDYDKLIDNIKLVMNKIDSKIEIKPREKERFNYEGVLTFEYLEKEEDLLAPALYKDIITNEKIKEEDYKKFHEYILSFNNDSLKQLIKNLDLFKNIPFEILSKYWARCYTIESDFYGILNNELMKSKLNFNYKTFIKMLYTGVEINSLNSYSGEYLYRGATINKIELDKIIEYKKSNKLSQIVVFSKAFLSFSEVKSEAEIYCGSKNKDNTQIGCLFILENKNNNLHESNGNIQKYSQYPKEKEILFFPGSSFIITDIEEINENRVSIKLNYHGKFKEKFNLIFQDDERINSLIISHELTKNIGGNKLCFLNNGKYLKLDLVNKGGFCNIFKGKNLETDEIVCIKQQNKETIKKETAMKEIDIIKNISEKINYSCKFKDCFETKDYIYTILSYYDDNLNNFFKKNKKNFHPNLIKKIFKELNLVFKELLDKRIVHRNIMPSNILIKYSNEEKTNFDSILTDYGIAKEYDKDGKISGCLGNFNYMAPEIIYEKNKFYKNNCDLFSIGVTMYYLFFGKLPFNRQYIGVTQKQLNIIIDEDKQFEDLLIKLLKENPDERITWKEYFNHPFFKQYEY